MLLKKIAFDLNSGLDKSSRMFAIESPPTAWNAIFSEKDKLIGARLFGFFKKKGYADSIAIQWMNMALYKGKYHGLRYSVEQERELQRALTQVASLIPQAATSTPTL